MNARFKAFSCSNRGQGATEFYHVPIINFPYNMSKNYQFYFQRLKPYTLVTTCEVRPRFKEIQKGSRAKTGGEYGVPGIRNPGISQDQRLIERLLMGGRFLLFPTPYPSSASPTGSLQFPGLIQERHREYRGRDGRVPHRCDVARERQSNGPGSVADSAKRNHILGSGGPGQGCRARIPHDVPLPKVEEPHRVAAIGPGCLAGTR